MNETKNNSVTILLAEDEQFLSRTYENRLSAEGFKVILAKDGEEAFEKAVSEKPDIILLDLIMPKKNGFEVLETIKKTDVVKNIPIIVTSNLGQDSDIEKAKKLGAIDYIIKSNVPMKEVVATIKKHLDL